MARTVRRRRPGRAGTAGLGLAAAGLVTAGVLLPSLPGSAAVDPSAAEVPVVDGGGAAPPDGGGTAVTGGLPGSIVVPGPAVPADPTFVVPAPVVVPSRLPAPFVPRGEPAVTKPPPAACGGYAVPRRIVPGATAAGGGAATVTWRADSHADVTGYRVRAVSQTLVAGLQADPVTVPVAQPSGCVPVTATVAGLTPGSYYVFWLEEAQRDTANGVTRYVQVGGSDPVRIG